jgi:MOSC domain-containing protein YiiM
MDPVAEARLITGEGIEGDANRGRSQRQVTVIEADSFDTIREAYPDATPGMRRANIMVRGVSLAESRGRVLKLGDVSVRLQGETRPCERMDAQCNGLTSALDPEWRGGAFGVVLDGGSLRVGDPAVLEPPESQPGQGQATPK